MSNFNPEQTYQTFGESLAFILEEEFKNLYTALPANIQSYDAQTKRATVIPAIKTWYEDDSYDSYPIVADVPVLMPSGGGYTITMPIKKGDAVLLVFSQRGIENFKKTFQESNPTTSLFDLHDAVAIAGFGALNIMPASGTGAALQTEDGSNAVIVEADQIKIKKGNNGVIVNDNELQASIAGSTMTLNSSEFIINAGSASLQLTASGLVSSVPVDAPTYASAGGAAKMTSGIDMSGQSITNAGDITSNGINLTTHKHTDSQGGQTSGPE